MHDRNWYGPGDYPRRGYDDRDDERFQSSRERERAALEEHRRARGMGRELGDRYGGPRERESARGSFDDSASYEFGPADRRDNRERGLQGNYGETGRDFGFARGPSARMFDEGPFARGNFRGGPQGREEESWGRARPGSFARAEQREKRLFRGPKGYQRSDERIREDVSDRFAEQDQVDPSDIEVTVAQGEVTLSGTVRSRAEKFWAEEIADAVSGVRDVHNRLRLRREDDQPARPRGEGDGRNARA